MFNALRDACLAVEIQVISIDMFDTLIFRNTGEPKDLFRALAIRALASGLLLDDDIDSFVSLRKEAEEQARLVGYKKTGSREVTLFDIYQEISYFNSDIWCQLEAEVEQADWYLNEPLINILELAQQNDKQLVLLSDMYLPESILSNYLKAKCPQIHWTKIWVSGDRKKSKVDGLAFRALLLELGIKAENILHVGDNLVSDVQMAQAAGLQAFHLSLSDYLQEIDKLERVITPYNIKGLLRLRRTLMQGQVSENSSSYYALGSIVYGPVLVAFARWVVNVCNENGIKTLYCLLREGQVIADVILALFPEFDVQTISVSRRSSLLPSLKELTTQQLYTLSERRGYCLAELADDVGHTLPAHLNLYKDSCLSDLVNQSHWQLIVDWVSDNNLSINKYLIEQNNLLARYLLEKGIKDSEDQALLDWGCGGSMLSTISKLMNLNLNHNFLFYRKPTAQALALKNRLHCFQPQCSHLHSMALARSPELSEVLLNQTLSSTLRYQQGHEKIDPMKCTNVVNNARELNSFREAVLDCATIAARQGWLLNDINVQTRARMFTILYRLIDYPLYSEAMTLKNLFVPCLTLNKATLLPENDIKELGDKLASTCWHGYLQYSDPSVNRAWWYKGLLSLAHPGFLQQQGYFFQLFDDDSLPVLLLEKLQSKNLDNVVIYGAGELGHKVHSLFKVNNISTQFFIDRRAESGAFKLNGLPVFSLKEAEVAKGDTIVIASRAFVKEIHCQINNRFKNNYNDIIAL